uniref:Uncharacterized protein n=1 Tax=Plectus sambesii TaxID=2011161 RepID=A0A914VJ35_9BILA
MFTLHTRVVLVILLLSVCSIMVDCASIALKMGEAGGCGGRFPEAPCNSCSGCTWNVALNLCSGTVTC